MANRLNYYFRQKVTESELDLGFAYLEMADRALASDLGIGNVTFGLGVAQQTVPNLTVKVAGPGAAYDSQGRRMAIASDQNVNCALDFNNVSTAVAVGGNEKWLSIFAYFDRTLSDPRVDGNAATVYFEEAEVLKFKVVQGAEALIGTATRPALIVDHVLLADVKLVNAQTQIVNANISTTRRQTFFDIAGTPFSIKQGRFNDALGEMLGHLNTHITTGGPGVHQAVSIAYAGGPAWADASTNPAADVEVQLDKIVGDLAATTGAPKVGAAATGGAPNSLVAGSVKSQLDALLVIDNAHANSASAHPAANITYAGGPNWADAVTNPATSVEGQLDKIITDLAALAGALKVGAGLYTGAQGFNLAAGTVKSQLDALAADLNGMRAGAGGRPRILFQVSFGAALSTGGGSRTVNVGTGHILNGLKFLFAGLQEDSDGVGTLYRVHGANKQFVTDVTYYETTGDLTLNYPAVPANTYAYGIGLASTG